MVFYSQGVIMTAETEALDVLIVGAGPVGLFAANECARHGLTCRIIDKKDALSDKSKALGLHIRTLEMFRNTGLFDEVRKQGMVTDHLTAKAGGKLVAEISFELLSDTSLNYMIMLPQDRMERILYDSLRKNGLDIEWLTELTSIVQDNDSVSVQIKKSDASIEEINAKWVIACDGSHSTIRTLLGLEFIGGDYDTHWWLADINIDWNLPPNKLIMYFSDKGPLACFPLSDTRYRLVLQASHDFDFKKDPTFEDISQAFAERSLEQGAKIYDPIWITKFYIHHRQVQKYSVGRIFLAGDAAHVHSPMGAQGMNTGMQDVYNLAWKIALVNKKQAVPSLLDSYHNERFPIGKEVVFITDKLTKAMSIKNPFLIFLRNQFVKLMSSFSVVKRRILSLLSQMDFNYRHSPIVETHSSNRAIRAGDLMANAKVFIPATQQETSFFEYVIGTKHHLLIFSGKTNTDCTKASELAEAMMAKYGGLMKCYIIAGQAMNPLKIKTNCDVLHDRFNLAHKAYGMNEMGFCLLRPDRYVGFISQPGHQAQLERYLNKWYTLG